MAATSTTTTTTTNVTHQIEVDPKKTLTQPRNPPSDLNLTPSTEGRHSAADTTSPSASLPASTEAAKKDVGYQTKTDSGALTAAAGTDTSGPVTDIQRKIRRAERFGVPVQLSEEEKRNSRAKRFGTASALSSSDLLKKSEEQKRKARAERFGTAKSSRVDEEAKKAARLARFTPYSKADSVEEDKKKARALRFAQPMSSSLTHVNGKGDVEQKSTVAGKAGGT